MLQTWHVEMKSSNNVMRYPQNGPTWKHIDKTWPKFGRELQNFHMGLAIDGVTLSSSVKKPNLIWPVLLINYNILPWYAMKLGHVMLSLIIPGPHACKTLDVYMAPLIEDLTSFWEVRVPTFDVTQNIGEGDHSH